MANDDVVSMEVDDHIELSSYAENLEPGAKRRYKQKISEIFMDPYLLKRKDVMKLEDMENYPDIEYTDIAHYLVYTSSYVTAKEMKCYKSLDGYKKFINGFVFEMFVKKIDAKFIFIGKVSIICWIWNFILAVHVEREEK